ncbi:hypothetical protein CIT292_08537 [Citrobacter youngae ATCC 29220]|uniref:Uncharacterized protein n=1 Tax=Citrobacter youngae ATCC 29220 TaxID=500640 RepID=D4BDH0_9ENTR|nr:hypothetical protein CIT292_08537 [Citrobacter youngae ATCC 29220]
MQGGGESGIAAAHDTDITANRFAKGGERFVLIGACGVITAGMFSHD